MRFFFLRQCIAADRFADEPVEQLAVPAAPCAGKAASEEAPPTEGHRFSGLPILPAGQPLVTPVDIAVFLSRRKVEGKKVS